MLDRWLKKLGYADVGARLVRDTASVGGDRPYASELKALLDPAGEIRAAAVFEIDGVPAVCFIEGDPLQGGAEALSAIQSRVWNQGLVSVILQLGDEAMRAYAAIPGQERGPLVRLDRASDAKAYSAEGVQTSLLLARHPDWFQSGRRIDQDMLANLKTAVQTLQPHVGKLQATQYLMAQVLFVSYLDHRGIVHDAYRAKYGVGRFSDLVAERDGAGLDALFAQLKEHFNGDFLSPQGAGAWAALPSAAFDILDSFLKRTDLRSGQQELWRYDFRYIPVELLSGIYESFLGSEAAKVGAFYTPRHLANLAVDEAMAGLTDDEVPVVFDGACGSGILLTTIFRRLLGRAERRAGKRLSLRERSDLLRASIFGADTNVSACRVTAFSLYLSILEDLIPQDIAQLTRKQHDKLPTLLGKNIFAGAKGDMFGDDHPISAGHMPQPTIMLSNPPWVEPDREDKPTFERWATRADVSARVGRIPLRQIAIAFTYRATELAPGARLCLILPASAFVKPQPRAFVQAWLRHVRLERLINFSDMRSLLFRAHHACMIAVARAIAPERGAPEPEVEYLTPKADLSLAYNRLTIHFSDRHLLSQNRIINSPQILQRLYWGSDVETALLERLCGRGTIEDLVERGRFVKGKGFHVTDGKKRAPLDALARRPFLSADSVPKAGPALPEHSFQALPYKRVASVGDERLYAGARVVFTDGLTSHRRLRACFSATEFSFNNSVGALRDLEDDAGLMGFLASYLSSDLAAYFALLTAPTAVLERTQIKLVEVTGLPFWLPEEHPEPAKARAVIKRVAKFVAKSQKQADQLLQPSDSGVRLDVEIEAAIREYFQIDPRMSQIVDETMAYVMPSVQPSTTANFPMGLHAHASEGQLHHYAQVLTQELRRYRDLRGGSGRLVVKVAPWRRESPYGVVMATTGDDTPPSPRVQERAVREVMATLDRHALLTATTGGITQTADLVIRSGNTLIFAKPLTQRLWLTSAAMTDALRLVRHVTRMVS